MENSNESPTVVGSVEETKDLTQVHSTSLSGQHTENPGSVDHTPGEKVEESHKWKATLVRRSRVHMLSLDPQFC